jgi:sugar lactone lactonase YvrE
MSIVEVALEAQAELGEGPIWDAARRQLLFVDIMHGEVHAFDPATRIHAIYEVGQPAGAVTPTTRGDWLVAARDGFYRLDPATGQTRLFALVEADKPDNRMNDGYCDARGRFWAGTMSMAREKQAGALYRLDPNGVVTSMLGGVTTSNGVDWSLDGTLMYYIDTDTSQVDVFDFDAARGTIANRRPFAVIPPDAGRPDGLIVDAEGGIWVALWGGSAIRRYTSTGELERTIPMPVPHPTKCAFGGPDLDVLYITSASIALSPQQRAANPRAGDLFHCRPGVKGRPATAFAG